MPITWNDKAHTKLPVAILRTTNAKLDFGAIANYMGPGCTTVAVRLHIQQLKRQVAEASGSITGGPKSQSRTRTTGQGRRSMGRMQQREDLKLEESPNKKVEDAKMEDIEEDANNAEIKEEDEKIEDIEEDVVGSEDIKREVLKWMY